jgi:hypothetical protein
VEEGEGNPSKQASNLTISCCVGVGGWDAQGCGLPGWSQGVAAAGCRYKYRLQVDYTGRGFMRVIRGRGGLCESRDSCGVLFPFHPVLMRLKGCSMFLFMLIDRKGWLVRMARLKEN